MVTKTLNTHDISLAQLQSAYANGTKGNKLKTTDISQQAIANIVGTLNVDWTSYTLQQFPDSTQVIEFPMPDDTTLIAPSDSIKSGNNNYRSKTSAVFILHKDTIALDFFMKTVEDLNDPSYQSVIDQQHYLNTAATFNGEIMYFTLDRQFINGYLWKNGSITKGLSIGAYASQPPLQTQSTESKTKTVDVQYTNCVEDTYEIVEITTVTSAYGTTTTVRPTGQSVTIITCDVVGSPPNSGGVSTGGGVPPPPPCNPGSGGTVTSSVKGGRLIINVTTGGSGSGTTTTTSPPCLTNPTTPVSVPPPTTTPTTTDPCAQKSQVSTRAANTVIASQNTQIQSKSTTVEYGTDENLTSLTSNTYFNTSVSAGTASTWPSTFTWDATNGYTIGWSHGHPQGSAPSPDDIFVMMQFLTDPALTKAGTSAIQYYRNNVSVTVVTNTGNYVVTVNDWGALGTLYDKYDTNPTTFDNNYVTTGQSYLTANPTASSSDAGIYSLISIFGSAINIYEAPSGSTTYTPLTLNSTTNKVTTKPCPSN